MVSIFISSLLQSSVSTGYIHGDLYVCRRSGFDADLNARATGFEYFANFLGGYSQDVRHVDRAADLAGYLEELPLSTGNLESILQQAGVSYGNGYLSC
jgi:hypothetical protein